jgi:hypothetical protein
MVACRMEKTRSGGYKRLGEKLRVSGLLGSDNYDAILTKAATGLGVNTTCSSEAGCCIVLGSAKVLNCPLQNGLPWTLGAYLDELGGSKKLILGIYLPDDVSDFEMC